MRISGEELKEPQVWPLQTKHSSCISVGPQTERSLHISTQIGPKNSLGAPKMLSTEECVGNIGQIGGRHVEEEDESHSTDDTLIDIVQHIVHRSCCFRHRRTSCCTEGSSRGRPKIFPFFICIFKTNNHGPVLLLSPLMESDNLLCPVCVCVCVAWPWPPTAPQPLEAVVPLSLENEGPSFTDS